MEVTVSCMKNEGPTTPTLAAIPAQPDSDVAVHRDPPSKGSIAYNHMEVPYSFRLRPSLDKAKTLDMP
jgi:hypothetical protein